MKVVQLYRSAAILVIAFFLVNCSSNSYFAANSQLQSPEKRLAVLTGYQINRGFITIQTVSYGCTFFDSFKVDTVAGKSNSIKVWQVKPDNCGMSPHLVSLQYSFKHLGIDLDQQIYVANQLETKEKLALLGIKKAL